MERYRHANAMPDKQYNQIIVMDTFKRTSAIHMPVGGERGIALSGLYVHMSQASGGSISFASRSLLRQTNFACRRDDRVGNRLRMTQHCDVTRIDMNRRCAD